MARFSNLTPIHLNPTYLAVEYNRRQLTIAASKASSQKSAMSNIAKFGLSGPFDLYEKLKHEAKPLLQNRTMTPENQRLEEFEAFNFFVTAWHLHKDWLQGASQDKPMHSLAKMRLAAANGFTEIYHVMRDIANGSKHFELNKPPKVSVGEREISSWSTWFFGPAYSVDTESFHFLMYEVVSVVKEYFDWIFDDLQPVAVPPQIIEKLKTARGLRIASKKNSEPNEAGD